MPQYDEVWSFVGDKDHKSWLWLAMESSSGRIVGLYWDTPTTVGSNRPEPSGATCRKHTATGRYA